MARSTGNVLLMITVPRGSLFNDYYDPLTFSPASPLGQISPLDQNPHGLKPDEDVLQRKNPRVHYNMALSIMPRARTRGQCYFFMCV